MSATVLSVLLLDTGFGVIELLGFGAILTTVVLSM